MVRTQRAVRLAAVLLGLAAAGAMASVEQGDKAPAWAAHDFAGHAVDFPGVTQGKPTIVIFWATWCPYCKAFMPYLKNIATDYARQGVEVCLSTCRTCCADRKADAQRLGLRPIAIAIGNGDRIMQRTTFGNIPAPCSSTARTGPAYRRPGPTAAANVSRTMTFARRSTRSSASNSTTLGRGR